MILTNEIYKYPILTKEYVEGYVKMIYPFAPHLGEELWEFLGYQQTITYENWPNYDNNKTINQEVTVVVQIMVNFEINYKLVLIPLKKN